MLKQFLLTAVFSALALGAALAAEPASLSGNELRKAVSGKTILSTSRGLSCRFAIPPTAACPARWGPSWRASRGVTAPQISASGG
jgi:hypothetical protein